MLLNRWTLCLSFDLVISWVRSTIWHMIDERIIVRFVQWLLFLRGSWVLFSYSLPVTTVVSSSGRVLWNGDLAGQFTLILSGYGGDLSAGQPTQKIIVGHPVQNSEPHWTGRDGRPETKQLAPDSQKSERATIHFSRLLSVIRRPVFRKSIAQKNEMVWRKRALVFDVQYIHRYINL